MLDSRPTRRTDPLAGVSSGSGRPGHSLSRARRRRTCFAAFATTALAAVLFLAAACSASQEISLDIDGGGGGELEIRLHPMFVSYYRDLVLSFAASAPEDVPIFDLQSIEAGFAAGEHVTLVDAEVDDPGTLRLVLSFDDVGRVMEEGAFAPGTAGDAPREPVLGNGSASLFSYSREDAVGRLQITLDRRVVEAALAMAPIGDMGSVGLLLPPEGGEMSADEYADYVAWALEEYAGDGDALSAVNESRIRLDVRVPGTVVSVRGGEQTERGARFEISIPELLTLAEPVAYEIAFRVE